MPSAPLSVAVLAALLLLLVQPSHADFRACSMNIPSPANCLPVAYACSPSENPLQVPNPIFQKPNPGLTWSSVPGASSYTVVMEDATEFVPGQPVSIVHWMVQGISASGASFSSCCCATPYIFISSCILALPVQLNLSDLK
jgi:hypothetical protein